jgi:hypothetical protein
MARSTGRWLTMQHIYVEPDECDLPVLESCRRSYDYLRKLRL